MVKPDFSKTIGFIKRGGNYSASNEISEQKIEAVMAKYPTFKVPTVLTPGWFFFVERCAREQGYSVRVIQRGLFR